MLVLKLDPEKKKRLMFLQSHFLAFKEKIVEKVKALMQMKDGLMEEVNNLDSFIDTNLIHHFDPTDVLTSILWAIEVT